jgi:Mg2+ and Co2+ transporter CorA
MVKSAVEMSSEKIKADLIRSNSDAIVYANSQLITSISAIDVETMNTKVAVIQSVLKIAGSMSNLTGERILTNSKSIVTFMTDVVDKKMPKSKPNVDAFSKSIENLKTAFKDLDTILIKDEDKRNKALDEFEKRIKAVVEDVNGGKNAIESLNNLIKNAQTYKAPEYTPAPQQQYTPQTPGTPNNTTVNQQVNTQSTQIDYEALAKAIVDSLKTLKLNPVMDGAPDGAMSVKLNHGFAIE